MTFAILKMAIKFIFVLPLNTLFNVATDILDNSQNFFFDKLFCLIYSAINSVFIIFLFIKFPSSLNRYS